MSAVSKNVIPSSTARRRNGRLSSSVKIHGLHFGVPYVIVPRQIRETLRPLLPRFVNFTLWKSRKETMPAREIVIVRIHRSNNRERLANNTLAIHRTKV